MARVRAAPEGGLARARPDPVPPTKQHPVYPRRLPVISSAIDIVGDLVNYVVMIFNQLIHLVS